MSSKTSVLLNRQSAASSAATTPSSTTPSHSTAPALVNDVLREAGSPLDKETRALMEPRFGHDFSKVRIHADGRAAESARAVQSNAYAVGSHIVFDSGQYAPASFRGRSLLAHELAHVVQQSQISSAAPGAQDLAVVPPDAKSEREADAAAQSVLSGTGVAHGAALTPAPAPTVQRQAGAEVAGLVMGGLGLLQGQVNVTQGELKFSSAQLQYPKEQERVGPDLKHVNKLAAEFYAEGTFIDNKTKIFLRGEFSDSYAPATEQNRVMSNVYLDIESTTTYSKSELSFTAVGLDTPYGTAKDPKVRFACAGHFDPVGEGDVGYRALLEIDQHANVNCIEFSLTHGEAFVTQSKTTGFRIELKSQDSKNVLEDNFQTTDEERKERINEAKKANAEWEKFLKGVGGR